MEGRLVATPDLYRQLIVHNVTVNMEVETKRYMLWRTQCYNRDSYKVFDECMQMILFRHAAEDLRIGNWEGLENKENN